LHEAVHDLVQRSVAADRNDDAGIDLGGELDQMAGALRVDRVAVEPEACSAMCERGPDLARLAVARRRVDEEDGANGRR
jgi:hypothetical protein